MNCITSYEGKMHYSEHLRWKDLAQPEVERSGVREGNTVLREWCE